MKRKFLGVLVCALLVPAAAFAQASITGTVRDTSGALLPGVTVEAASPALIEKIRVVTTDGTGQYRAVDLRPGTYTVTFTLAGFSTVKIEGVALTGSFTATVNADMRVGALEETVTVTGRAATVDVQSTSQQRVMTKELIDTIPSGRRVFDAGVLVPGVYTSSGDVGGTAGPGPLTTLSVHGSRGGDQRVTLNGLAITNLDGSGSFAAYNPNLGSSQEVTFDTSGVSAESSHGGVAINIIPKEGGNDFSSTFFATGVTSAFQGSNHDDDLRARGFRNPNDIKRIFDVNPGVGGPIKRDSVWFYASGRWNESTNWTGGMYHNANLGKTNLPDAWLYVPDLSRPASSRAFTRSINGRVTWQANTKDKFSFFYDSQAKCNLCPGSSAILAPETTATGGGIWPVEEFASASWTSVRTSRLLLDVGVGNRDEHWENNKMKNAGRDTLLVTDQATGISYHGLRVTNNATFSNFDSTNWTVRASASYVTGSHLFKVGVTDLFGSRVERLEDNTMALSYRFNGAVPNQITQRATPVTTTGNLDADFGIFAQDRWTIRRLTVNAGLRFDWFKSSYPAQHLGPGRWVPNRNVDLPAGTLVDWKDLGPRVGLAYDLFGDNRTALKVALNRYVTANALHGVFGAAGNPVIRYSNPVTRSWNDANTNYVPDCDLLRIDANGECGPLSDNRFGQAVATLTYDDDIVKGFGKRGYNWEFSTIVEQQLTGNVSASVGYFRRSYGNVVILDNRATTAADYTRFSIPVPVNALLPGSGSRLDGFYDLNPNKVGQVDNYATFAEGYGGVKDLWHGADVSVNLRNWRGLLVQGGFSTGRRIIDRCDMVAKVPEMLSQLWPALSGPGAIDFVTGAQPSDTWCNTKGAWLTQAKMLGSYTIPRIGVQTSATFQSLPGPELAGSYVATNAVVSPSLGRVLSANAPSTSLQLVQPGVFYGERLNQVDLRFSKKLPLGRTTTALNLDVYNATNANPVVTENASFALFRVPTSVLPARFAKISVQFDF